ncbi:Uu.00g100220.m01.CDS01 [Anthostomella pinea]|uniref:Uu.00g100220.m01.CDS01 n=1 Tax=Anthostomella pinea TaxID=933095 RepID=A0AAI8VDH0_9PEZI|nr:Uu.00g100220.m01.CDS01 [Anthostomella pinea]
MLLFCTTRYCPTTWEEEKVLFPDVEGHTPTAWRDKKGFRKIELCSQQAIEDGYNYIWVDTCCIDKSSSAELSEAINSMFEWYSRSQVCYAYLGDAIPSSPFDKCRWFTRGWTLQELVAPRKVHFYNQDWQFVGSRYSLADELVRITRIDRSLFRTGFDDSLQHVLGSYSIATRMSWASRRNTTRLEDTVYCLMGLFGVNMPLLYGEGKRAFRRLQDEIMRKSTDTSVLACVLRPQGNHLLAESPSNFENLPVIWNAGSNRRRVRWEEDRVELEMILCPTIHTDGINYFGLFDCMLPGEYDSWPAILLTRDDRGPDWFTRILPHRLFRVSPSRSDCAEPLVAGQLDHAERGHELSFEHATRKLITISRELQEGRWVTDPVAKVVLDFDHRWSLPYYIDRCYPSISGGMICHSPRFVWWIHTISVHGIVAFYDGATSRFFVAWGGLNKPDTSPWCKIWLREELQIQEIPWMSDTLQWDDSGTTPAIQRARHSSQARLMELPSSQLSRESKVSVQGDRPHTVEARISETTILERVTYEILVRTREA